MRRIESLHIVRAFQILVDVALNGCELEHIQERERERESNIAFPVDPKVSMA
jgi:hypothetical protein